MIKFNMQIMVTEGQKQRRATTAEAEDILTAATSCRVIVTQEKYTSNTFVVTVYTSIDKKTIKNRITQYFERHEEYEGWFL